MRTILMCDPWGKAGAMRLSGCAGGSKFEILETQDGRSTQAS
jgi:hypothetical protein